MNKENGSYKEMLGRAHEVSRVSGKRCSQKCNLQRIVGGNGLVR